MVVVVSGTDYLYSFYFNNNKKYAEGNSTLEILLAFLKPVPVTMSKETECLPLLVPRANIPLPCLRLLA